MKIKCSYCKILFDKPVKEFNRRSKLGITKFYCSRSCSAKLNKNAIANKGKSAHNKNNHNPFLEYVRRAKVRKKFKVNIDSKYLEELWNNQKGKCALSNIPIEHPKYNKNINYMASLDRIDSSKGYVKGNVQFVSCAINYAKHTKEDSSIKEFINLIIKYNGGGAGEPPSGSK